MDVRLMVHRADLDAVDEWVHEVGPVVWLVRREDCQDVRRRDPHRQEVLDHAGGSA